MYCYILQSNIQLLDTASTLQVQKAVREQASSRDQRHAARESKSTHATHRQTRPGRQAAKPLERNQADQRRQQKGRRGDLAEAVMPEAGKRHHRREPEQELRGAVGDEHGLPQASAGMHAQTDFECVWR